MTIPKDCKRLAEVDFPIAEVSKHASREKSIRYGHPSTLHMWWARRPLASSRAVLMALLLPDPIDPLCPTEFKTQARELLSQVQNVDKDDAGIRAGLLKFIGEFASWDLGSNQQYINVARGLVKASHPDETPLVVDTFAGGGSIPLEALRLGCDTFASDLNPVAGLIQKVMLEDIPRYGHQKIKMQTERGEVEADGLATALRIAGSELKQVAERELSQFYPPDLDGSRPIAYIWARTVQCESPNCGAEIPLMRSFWLSKKGNHRVALRSKVIRELGKTPHVEFEIFTPIKESEVQTGTVKRANATCMCCQTILPAERVRTQLANQNGGADIIFDNKGNRVGGTTMIAVVTVNNFENGRQYRLANNDDFNAAWKAQLRLSDLLAVNSTKGHSLIPDEAIPMTEIRRISLPLYGMKNWGDVYTARQKLTLLTFARIVKEDPNESINNLLIFAISGLADHSTSACAWRPDSVDVGHTFGRQAIPISWDFAEVIPIGDSTGSITATIDRIARVVETITMISSKGLGQIELADACNSPLPDRSSSLLFTDPPYYDSVPYAHLSDFFYVWIKRTIYGKYKDWFLSPLTPKENECVVDRPHSLSASTKTKEYFESKMASAMREGWRILRDDGIASIVFAHKTTEGWESLLGGMIKGGWTITGSWPIATEMSTRLVAKETASLATSIHLICRPRSINSEIGDWTQVSRELPRKVGDWMQRLQSEGVRGADLVFACIGPALEIYSRYSKVVDAEDREIPLGGDPEAREPHLRGYLAYVWEVVGRLALEQVLGTSETQKDATNALEEDARLTALFLWTKGATSPTAEKSKTKSAEFHEEAEPETEDDDTPKKKSKGGFALPFDVVRRFAQPLGIHLPEWENRIIDTDKGVVTLLSVKDRAQQLFGEDGASAFASEIEDNPIKSMQMSLFAEAESAPKVRGRRKAKNDWDVSFQEKREATTLDRLHAAMLLQKGGQTTALRTLLQSESERGSDFMRLANALTALYPRESEEKRLLDALLVNVRR
jgi:putative DNA methylase